ncbi:hypothetical protein [Pedobacter immunditicola]|uniref:hypothetical protein n=1 Tax=Pedobacter immunditicola TaxID=3133440 RepID=UPI0030A0E3EC
MSMDLKAEDSLLIGDQLMADRKYVAIKVRSAVNPYEFNVLLNPLFRGYHDLIQINSVENIKIDSQLIKSDVNCFFPSFHIINK